MDVGEGQVMEKLAIMTGEITGHGDIAQALAEADLGDKLFFASGVSNSQETRESEYQREKDLLLAQDRTRHVVYFGSLSIFYADGRYQQHKKEMEQLVRDNFPHYSIIRIGNITWGDNPHTIINFFKEKIQSGEPFEVRDDYRYIVTKQDFLDCVNSLPDTNVEKNLMGERVKVATIVKRIKEGQL